MQMNLIVSSIVKHTGWTSTCDRPTVKIDKIKQLIIIDEEHEVSWGWQQLSLHCRSQNPLVNKTESHSCWLFVGVLLGHFSRRPGGAAAGATAQISFSHHSVLPIATAARLSASLTRPTFIAYSYKYTHDDGRVSYPLCFIFSSPVGQ